LVSMCTGCRRKKVSRFRALPMRHRVSHGATLRGSDGVRAGGKISSVAPCDTLGVCNPRT
jgi:hypothetical protein